MRQRRPYVNHDEARRVLSSTLASDGPRLITIRADSGKGKSTLLSWFEDQCRAKTVPCAMLTFREVKSFDGFLVLEALARRLKPCPFDEYQKGIGELLASAGASVTIQNVTLEGSQISGIQAIGSDPVRKRHILARLSESWFADVEAFAAEQTAARAHRVVVILDTFEEASDEVKVWLEDALQIVREKANVSLVVAGQKRIEVDAARWCEECRELELPAKFEYCFWREYAAGTGALEVWGEEHLQRLHKIHHGDPQMMSVLCDVEAL
jgi:hypothetical protein